MIRVITVTLTIDRIWEQFFYNEEQWKFNILITFNAQETELKQFSISEFLYLQL